MDGNILALEKLRPRKTEVVETMYPEDMYGQPQMDMTGMQPPMAGQQMMPEMGGDPNESPMAQIGKLKMMQQMR
jgi:hypothetical protein